MMSLTRTKKKSGKSCTVVITPPVTDFSFRTGVTRFCSGAVCGKVATCVQVKGCRRGDTRWHILLLGVAMGD